MIRNYIKTAWRTLILNRTYSMTNIIGLTVGLIVVMLISSLVLDELSYDRQWKNSDDLYRIRSIYSDAEGNETQRVDYAMAGLGNSLTAQFPEVMGSAKINSTTSKLKIDGTSNRYLELTILESDTNFFNLFDIQAIAGDPKQTAAHMKNLAITESTHKRYFAGKPILGDIYYDIPEGGEPQAYIISAILQDLPDNSHLHAEAILISTGQEAFTPDKIRNLDAQYILTQKGINPASLTSKINSWFADQEKEQFYEQVSFQLQPIKDIHLRSVTGWDSPMRDIYFLSGISLLILILVSINYINLTFAHVVRRTMETGIRKVLGAKRIHLILQLATESLLLFGTALSLAFPIYIILLPLFEKYLGQSLTLTFYTSPPLVACLILFWILLALICSIFPAISLSKAKPSEGLKKHLSLLQLPLNTAFTRGLIAIQFAIAIVVAVCMLSIRAQLKYMNDKDLGYEPHNILVINYTTWEGKAKPFKETILQHRDISAASFSRWTPFSGSVDFHTFEYPEKPERSEQIAIINADFDFVKTLGIQVTAGRDLQPEYALDAVSYDSETLQREIYSNTLVTETTAKKLGLHLNQGSVPLRHTPVGFIRDFNAASLRYPIGLVAVQAQREWEDGCMVIRIEEGKRQEALAFVTDTWHKFFLDRIPRIDWLDEQVINQYQVEYRLYQRLAFFSAISMFIALLGVLGIAVYTIERKVKEIGIRKVLGASVHSIILLISASFTWLVLIAAAIAFPIAWWFVNNWLDNFAYRIDVPIHIFALTGWITLTLMWTVVGIRALHAAQANPADSLRDE